MSAAGTRKAAGTGRQTGTRRVPRKAAQRKHGEKIWLWRGAAACAVTVFGLVAWAVVARALAGTANTQAEHFDALIVLGYSADSDGNPTPVQLARVTEAVREYERGVAPRVIVTGGAAHNKYVEADVMARIARAQGIPADAVIEETEAQDTAQNACYSLKIMRSHGWHSAEVVSSASHLPRAALILSQLPMDWRVHAAPSMTQGGSTARWAALSAFEVLKTVRYLAWTRQVEPCRL